jgi:hypothetical protein
MRALSLFLGCLLLLAISSVQAETIRLLKGSIIVQDRRIDDFTGRLLKKNRETSEGEKEKASKTKAAETSLSSSNKSKWVGPLVACIVAVLVFAGATAYGLSEKKKDNDDNCNDSTEGPVEVKDPKNDSVIGKEEEEVDVEN